MPIFTTCKRCSARCQGRQTSMCLNCRKDTTRRNPPPKRPTADNPATDSGWEDNCTLTDAELDAIIAEQLPTMPASAGPECEYVVPGTATGKRKRSLTPVAWERGCRFEFVRDRRWNRLIDAIRPPNIWAEQVASGDVVGTQLEAAFVAAVQRGDYAQANRHAERIANHKSNLGIAPDELPERWLSGVRRDLERAGYALRPEVLGAHSIGSPTIRQRLFWGASRVSDTGHHDRRKRSQHKPKTPIREIAGCGGEGGWQRFMFQSECDPDGDGWCRIRDIDPAECDCIGPTQDGCEYREENGVLLGRLLLTDGTGRNAGRSAAASARHGSTIEPTSRFSADACDWLPFRDGKTRPLKRGLVCLAHEHPFVLADGRTGRATQSRAKILKAIGNAIVPDVGAAFIRAFMEA